MNHRHQTQTTRTTMRTLTECWQQARRISPGTYVKPLTDKEVGQLKYLWKCVGDEAADVAAFALKNWHRFASRAGVQAGVPGPEEPHIGFLVKHHAVAVNMWRHSKAQPSPPTTLPPPPPLPQTPIEVPHKLTTEELNEMLAGLKH